MSDTECPYCNKDIEVADSSELTPRDWNFYECPHCEETFNLQLEFVEVYEVEKTSCMATNPPQHDFEPATFWINSGWPDAKQCTKCPHTIYGQKTPGNKQRILKA